MPWQMSRPWNHHIRLVLLLALPTVVLIGMAAVARGAAEVTKAEPLLSDEALAFWHGPTVGSWRVPVLLKELGDGIKGLEVAPEHAVAAAAERYGLSPKDAARLVDAEVRVAAMLSSPRDWPHAEALEKRVTSAVARVPEPADRWRLLIRFYGSMPFFLPAFRDLSDHGIGVVVEAFEAGRLDDVWGDVTSGSLDRQETLNWLLTIEPGSRLLLAMLADSTRDLPGRAAIRLHLLRSAPEPDPALASAALRDLLAAGATASAVALWDEGSVALDLADEAPTPAPVRFVADSLAESMAAALWLEGRGDEAAELLSEVPGLEVGEEPVHDSNHLPALEARRAHERRLGQALRRRLLRNGLLRSGRSVRGTYGPDPYELDPYEVAVELLGVRDSAFAQASIGGPLWPRVAASWAAAIGHPTLERFFLISAWTSSRFDPNEEAHGGPLHWPRALDEGWISASLFELRESIYQETRQTRESIYQRILALEDSTTAGFFGRPEPSSSEPLEELARVVEPFSLRQLGRAAARAVEEGRDEAAEAEALDQLDSGVPPTLPASGDDVVAFGRDGGSWWVLHRDSSSGHPAASWNQAYWLSVSSDGGHSWAGPLHTGLILREPLEIVAESVEVESGRPAGDLSFLARKRNWVVPGRHLVTARDGGDVPIVFELRADLSDLRRDEDGDGWTDVFERGMGTDPESDDTDGDGIVDPEDPLPGHGQRPTADSEALAHALRYLAISSPVIRHALLDGEKAGDFRILTFLGPDLPLADMETDVTSGPLNTQTVVLPEAHADDDRVGGRLAPRIRLWLTNRDHTRAFLSWSGTTWGGVEFARRPDGWQAVAGHRGVGCRMVRIEPTAAESSPESAPESPSELP